MTEYKNLFTNKKYAKNKQSGESSPDNTESFCKAYNGQLNKLKNSSGIEYSTFEMPSNDGEFGARKKQDDLTNSLFAVS